MLFERRAKGMVATPYGEAFIRAANRILDETERFEVELDELVKPRGNSLVIGALPVAASGLLPELIAKFRTAEPDVDIRIVQDHSECLLAQLKSGALDLIVGRIYGDFGDGVACEPLYEGIPIHHCPAGPSALG